MNSHPNRETISIIGAGPAGLAAAHELGKNHIQAVVYESLPIPGGISRTEIYKGYRADLGGHRFFTRNLMLKELWQQIMGEDFLLRPRLSRIYYQGKFYDYPLRIKNVLQNLGVMEASLCLLSYFRAKAFPVREITTFQDWVSARFGTRLFDTFFKTYTEKVWGIPCSEISADWAAQRIRNLSLREAVKNAILAQAGLSGQSSVTSLIESFHYPRLGPGMMWEALAAEVERMGCRVEYQAKVQRINHQKYRVNSITLEQDSGRKTIPVNGCVSSMPLSELILSLDPPAPAEVRIAAKNLGYRDYIAVNLIIDNPNLFPDNWIYVHDPIVELGRIQNYKNWSPEMVPDPGKTVLGLEYFHFESDQEWNWPDRKLIERGTAELEKLGLIGQARVEDGWVTRVPKAYPVYSNNYQEDLEIIKKYLEKFDNLQTVGRNGTHRYNNMDHSMLSGILAASNLMGEKIDLWKINTEQEYHEEEGSLEKAATGFISELDPLGAGVAGAACLGLLMAGITLAAIFLADPQGSAFVALLANYFYGYSVSWKGALLILLEAGALGFFLGSSIAWLRNTISRILIG